MVLVLAVVFLLYWRFKSKIDAIAPLIAIKAVMNKIIYELSNKNIEKLGTEAMLISIKPWLLTH